MTKIQGVEALNLGSLDFVKVLDDKDKLLEEYDSLLESEKNLSFKNLLYALLAVFLVLALYIPKVYIANQIYKKSISLYKMEKELEYLIVEKKEILSKIQQKKYRVEVIDALPR